MPTCTHRWPCASTTNQADGDGVVWCETPATCRLCRSEYTFRSRQLPDYGDDHDYTNYGHAEERGLVRSR